jgi:hypothetical protein
MSSRMGGGAADAIGTTTWVIAEGYIPAWSHGPEPEFTSHETVFQGSRFGRPYRLTVPAKRTLHQRFNDLSEPASIPRGTDFASVIVSEVPIVVQHTGLDSRQSDNALITTIAYPAG